MTIEEAVLITDACMQHAWYRQGLRTDFPPSLEGYTLRQLLDANETVAGNQPEAEEEGKKIYGMHCDPRLVAALYVAYHYAPEDPKDCYPVAYGPESAVVVVRAPK